QSIAMACVCRWKRVQRYGSIRLWCLYTISNPNALIRPRTTVSRSRRTSSLLARNTLRPTISSIALTLDVCGSPIIMASAIELDDETGRSAIIIDDIRSYRMLTPEFMPLESSVTQQTPNDPLRDRAGPPKLTGTLFHVS